MPVVPHLLLTLAVRPQLIVTLNAERWCALHLLLGDVSAVALKVSGIGKLIPWDRAMVNTNAEKAAKGHVHRQDASTDFLDQQPLDRPICRPCWLYTAVPSTRSLPITG